MAYVFGDSITSGRFGYLLPTYSMMKNMSMHMGEYFFFSNTVKNFLFENLNFHGTGGVVAVCFIIFIFTFLLEGTKSLTFYLSLRLSQNPLTYGRTNMTSSSSIQSSDRLKLHFGGYVLHTINLILGYLLMLAIMSYDAYIFIAVILGSGLGYFIFGAVNSWNKARFHALKLNLYERYDSQAGLTNSEINSELSSSSAR